MKIIAADLLLQHRPSEELLRSLLLDLTDQTKKEVNTVLLSKLRDMLDKGDQRLSQVNIDFEYKLLIEYMNENSEFLCMILLCARK